MNNSNPYTDPIQFATFDVCLKAVFGTGLKRKVMLRILILFRSLLCNGFSKMKGYLIKFRYDIINI